MKKLLLSLMVVGVYVLHQDNWNWTNGGLVFGILPVGMAYHAAYSIVAALMMAVLVKFAWPKQLEDVQPENPSKQPSDEERRG